MRQNPTDGNESAPLIVEEVAVSTRRLPLDDV